MAEQIKTATLNLDGKTYDLPVYAPTLGPNVLDIGKLYAQADVFTFDPGFTSTAACESAITYIDGDKGELLHRGYPIEQIAKESHYLELCYLLLYGELPSAASRSGPSGNLIAEVLIAHRPEQPIAATLASSHVVLDIVIWGLVALIIQLGAFVLATKLMRGLPAMIEAGNVAAALLVIGIQLAIAILNAGAMMG